MKIKPMPSLEKESKKSQIYRAAAQLFKEKGYQAASMRNLAERVELRASSLYNHIGSKEEILQQICFEHAQDFLKAMQEVEQLPISQGQKIERLLRFHIRKALKEVSSLTVFNDEWKHLSSPHLEEFRDLRKDYENRFRSIIEQAVAKGELPNLDTELLLYALLNAIHWLPNWNHRNSELTASELEEQVLRILLKGIQK